jgi:hypothetical protein
MSNTARYGFAIFLTLYGIYQLTKNNVLMALLGIALAAVFLWLMPRR